MARSIRAAQDSVNDPTKIAEARAIRAAQDAVEFATEIATARQMVADGRTLEDVWRHLRAGGLDLIGSNRVTMAITGLPPHESKRALYLSDTWADIRPAIEQFENDVIEAALSMGAEVRVGGRRITAVSEL